MDAEEILEKALKMEKANVEFYRSLREKADESIKDLIDILIEEEEEHVRKIEERLKVVRILRGK